MNNKEYLKQWYQDNKERIKQEYLLNKDERNRLRRERRKTNPEIKKTQTAWCEKNIEKRREYARKFQNDPLKAEATRKRKREYWKKRKLDAQVRISLYMRNRIRQALKTLSKCDSSIKLLGCSICEYKIYLENKFTPEMTWENYGTYWHIDHIIPCASFDMAKEEEQRKCFHYTNTQPLEAKANISKGKRLGLVV